jgi:hypothetical protein
MKKAIIFLIMLSGLFLLSQEAEAAKLLNIKPLTVNGSLMVDDSMTSGSAVNSDAIKVRGNVGFAALLVTEEKDGGAGDIDIYAEYSEDGSNFYRPYTTDMAGTITIEGNIVTALGNATRYIVFTPRLAQWMRIVIDPDANSQVTATLIYQEER